MSVEGTTHKVRAPKGRRVCSQTAGREVAKHTGMQTEGVSRNHDNIVTVIIRRKRIEESYLKALCVLNHYNRQQERLPQSHIKDRSRKEEDVGGGGAGGAHHIFSHVGVPVDDPFLGADQTVHAGHGGAWGSRGELGQRQNANGAQTKTSGYGGVWVVDSCFFFC